jgi:pimeloyl-ACP methyl ester carboxylesterase
MVARARALWALARWLGPWADGERSPPVRRESVSIGGARGPFSAWVFSPPRQPIGSYLVAPGLHFEGPADPRMRRFCAVLAAAGFEVLAPFLPDFLALEVAESAMGDLDAAFEHLRRRSPHRPGVFSISFGSLPALRLAASPARRDQISHLICFGGYADLDRTLTFCLGDQPGAPRDPLNQPAVFINLLDHLDGVPADRAELVAGWMRYLRATWGRPEMKAPDRYQPVARSIAAELPSEVRELFLVGCGVEPGALDRCRAALVRRAGCEHLDPRPHLKAIRCPVTLVHGRDDDVIPHRESLELARAMPEGAEVEVLITGLYDHTRSVPRLGSLAREGATMLRVLGAMVRGVSTAVGAARGASAPR